MHNEQDSFMEEMKSQQKCLFDDYLFTVSALIHPAVIEEIASRVFRKAGIPIKRIENMSAQKKLHALGGKEIIFDCYAETDNGERIAIEVQNDASRFSHKRESFYVSELRIHESRGMDYDEMMPVYLIILHRHNPYKKEGGNLPVYIKECHYVGTNLYYNDDMNVLRVNGDYMERGDILGDLMRSMKAKRPEDAPVAAIADAISMVTKEIDMGKRYITMEDFRNHYIEKGRTEGLAAGIAEGKAAGMAEGKADMINNLRKLGVSEEIINKAVSANGISS